MANDLKMDKVFSILTLHDCGWSDRRIARELGIDRGAVARHIRLAGVGPKPATEAPAGSRGGPEAPPGSAEEPEPASQAPSGSWPGAEPASSQPAGAPGCLAGSASGSSDFDRVDSDLVGANRVLQPSQVQPPADGGFIALRPTAPGGNVPHAVAEDTALLGSNRSAAAVPYGTGGPAGAACLSEGGPSQPADGSAASSPPGGQGGQASQCEPYRQVILDKLRQALSAQRIYQDLVTEHGFVGSYYSVRRFVGKLAAATELPFRRLECLPGQEAQVDFGTGAPVIGGDGGRRKTHVFRLVLGCSRKGYSEATFRQATDEFLLCLENAFWHIGGVPRVTTIDNTKAAVKRADWYDPELNPKVQSFCEHYGTVILPTKPYHPRHKGKVERGVAYVQDNGLKGRSFASLADENRHLDHWEATVADTRIHGTTRRQVGRMFQEVEKPALLPLPAGRFPFFHEAQRRVHRDGHVEVQKAYYSVPPEYLGRTVWVRWDGRMVRVFNQRLEQIAVHAQHQPGRFSTQNQHIDPKKTSAVERGTDWLMGRISLIGPQTERWAKAMLEDRGLAGVRVLVGLRSLAGRYDSDLIEQACKIALTHGAFHLRTIRQLLKRGGGDRQTEFEFLQEHEIIRGLSDYGELVRAGQGEQPAMEPSLE